MGGESADVYFFNVFIMFALFIFSKMCQEDISTHTRYTCASTVANFKVESDGTTYITYQSVPIGKGYERFVSTISASIFFFFPLDKKSSCRHCFCLCCLCNIRPPVTHHLRIFIGRISVVKCWKSYNKNFLTRARSVPVYWIKKSLFYKIYRLQ